MARVSLILSLLVSALWAARPDSVIYVGPEEVVRFSIGSGRHEIGIKDGDTLKGPCRLVATDTRLYLLDQLNNRVLCYDTVGSFVFETETRFQPVDMAVDSSGHIYLLDNSSNPALVLVFDGIKEVERMEVKYDFRVRLDGLVIYPEYGLLLECRGRLFEPVPVFDIGGFLSCQPLGKKYRLPKKHTALLEGWWGHADGAGFWSTSIGSEICSKGENTLPFLENDTSIRVTVGVKVIVKREGVRSTTRNIHVRLNDKPTMFIHPIPEEYFAYNRDWRNVSVDDSGNIYIFASVPEGGASILRWRPSP